MVNPLKELFFCPKIRDNCKGMACIAMEKKTRRWSTEDHMEINWHSEDYHRCKHYHKVSISPGDSRPDIEYQSSTGSAIE